MQTLKVYLEEHNAVSSEYCSKHSAYKDDFLFFRGYDILVPFIDERFEFTHSFSDSDIIPVSINPQTADSPALTEKFLNFLRQFNKNQLIVDIGQLYHVGEGHSDALRLATNSRRLQELVRTIPMDQRPQFMDVHTNTVLNNGYQKPYPLSEHSFFVDMIYNIMITMYVDQPARLFDQGEISGGNMWWPGTEPDGTLNRKLYELSYLEHKCSDDYIKHLYQHGGGDVPPRLYVSPSRARKAAALRSYKTGYYTNRDRGEYDITIRDFLRSELLELLSHYPGYRGDPASGNFLMGQVMNEEQLYECILSSGRIHMYPINNTYYDTSVLSIYTETLVYNSPEDSGYGKHKTNGILYITEKTYQPLIKGHFILPFGYCGLIEELKDRGFRFPDWIDYSYSYERNDLIRWMQYCGVVKDLLSRDAAWLFNKKIEDRDILLHNRSVFFNNGYRNTVFDAIKSWARLPWADGNQLATKIREMN